MRIAPLLSVFLFATLASGCATQQQKIEAASVIKTKDDAFLPYREYTSGLLSENAPAFSRGTNQHDMLIGRVDKKTGTKSFAAQVILDYHEDLRRQFQSARNNRAEALKLVSVERIKSGCSRKLETCFFIEIVNVLIPESDLRAAGPEGYPVKLFARSGDAALVQIPKPVIASLLTKVDADPAVAPGTKTAAAGR